MSQVVLPFESLGNFKIVDLIGKGGMGDVYLGIDVHLKRQVAIKVLPADLASQPEFMKRFQTEAASAAKLAHPNVAQVYFFGEDHGHRFFAMEFVPGESLSSLLERRTKLTVSESVTIGLQMLAGLSAAHQHHLVHRDIKPGNVLLDCDRKRAVIADFGLVKSSDGVRTITGVVMGTGRYMSPEQARGGDIDARSDLYSVGCVLYRMLAGRPPFESDTITTLMYQHVHEQPRPLDDIDDTLPAGILNVVHRLLAKLPDDRFQSAGEVSQALLDFTTQNPPRVDTNDFPDDVTRQIEFRDEVELLTEVVRAPVAEPTEEFSLRPAPTPTRWKPLSNQWERLRLSVLAWFTRSAPPWANELLNTCQQVDGAIADYSQRKEKLQKLFEQANNATKDMNTYRSEYQDIYQQSERKLASATDDEREALVLRMAQAKVSIGQLDDQLADQESELETLRLALAKATSTLLELQTRRDVYQARLGVAQASFGQELATPRRSLTIAVIAVSALLIAGYAGIQFFGKGGSPYDDGPTALEITSQAKADGPKVKGVTIEPGRVLLPFEITAVSKIRRTGFGLPTYSLLVGGNDGSLITLSIRDEKIEVERLPGHVQAVRDVEFSPVQGAASAAGNDVVLWNLKSKRESRTFVDEQDEFSNIQFSRDGKRMLTTSGDRIKIFDIATEEVVLAGAVRSDGPIRNAQWSQDESMVLCSAGRKSLFKVSLAGGVDRLEYNTDSSISDLKWINNDAQVVGRSGRALKLWGAAADPVASLGEQVNRFDSTPGGERIVISSGSHGEVQVWDGFGDQEPKVLGHQVRTTALRISSDGATIVSASRNEVRFWPREQHSLANGEIVRFNADAPVQSVRFSIDGFHVVSAAQSLHQWNIVAPARSNIFQLDMGVAHAALSPDMKSIYYVTQPDPTESFVAFRRLTNYSSSTRDAQRVAGHQGPVTGIQFANGGRNFVTSGEDGLVKGWLLSARTVAFHVDVGKPVGCFEMLTDSGKQQVLVGSGADIEHWDFATQKLVRQFDSGHTFEVRRLRRVGDALWSVGGDGYWFSWDVLTGSKTQIARLGTGIRDMAVSRDESLAVLGCDDGMLRAYVSDGGNWKLVGEVQCHQGPVNSVDISPDASKIVSGGADSVIRVWSAAVIQSKKADP